MLTKRSVPFKNFSTWLFTDIRLNFKIRKKSTGRVFLRILWVIFGHSPALLSASPSLRNNSAASTGYKVAVWTK